MEFVSDATKPPTDFRAESIYMGARTLAHGFGKVQCKFKFKMLAPLIIAELRYMQRS